MTSHFELSDLDLKKQLEMGVLLPSLFTHEAHLRLAYILIRDVGISMASQECCHIIHNYTKALGAAEKFNKTITIAAVKAVYHFMLRSKTSNFAEFIREFPRLKFNFKDLMAAHYSFDIYHSETAKKIYLEPDLIAFN